ncbi:MAG: hypothetical protein ABSG65_35495, partial [Bryobacteraceae bacterium]
LAGRLRDVLPECSVDTVKDLGWSGQKDHVLVPNIQGRFDVCLMIDKGFEYEHDLKNATGRIEFSAGLFDSVKHVK